tara:strand:+ start:938 stop:1915 length:978 start_codon:yes stop_codon:yes gene_type:complete
MNIQTFASSPLRLSLLGGGTDIPHIFNKLSKGKTVTASLNLFVTVGCTCLPFFKGIKLKYSTNETVENTDLIIHPIFKEALKHFGFNEKKNNGIEIISTASLPSGNGLGSSAAFTASLIQCLNKHLNNKLYDKEELLNLSTLIERKSGNNNIGFQDQVASIYGSFSSTTYQANRIKVDSASKEWTKGMKNLIENRGFLIKTESRKGLSSDFIQSQSLEKNFSTYEELLSLAEEVNIEQPYFEEEKIINLLAESAKISNQTKIRTKLINELEESLNNFGAIYSKQLGAGGGGFIFCLFKNNPKNLPANLKKIMLKPKINQGGIKVF